MSVWRPLRRLAAGLITSVLTVSAAAEEPTAPCHEDADGSVTCDAAGFKTLVTKCSGYRTDRDLCRVDLREAQTKLTTTRASLDLCLSTPVPKPPPPQWSAKPTATFILGAVGTGLLLSTALLTTAPTDTKAILGSAGLVALGTGLWLSF